MKRNIFLGFGIVAVAIAVAAPHCYAAATKSSSKNATKQAAIQKGTTVRTRVAATGIYDQECYDAYYGCMDSFCITDNSNGGSCACSDENKNYEKRLQAIQDKLVEAERISTVEVEKIKAGGQADIIFTGERKYDENGNILKIGEMSEADAKAKKRADLMAMFNSSLYDEEDEEDVDLSTLEGGELFSAAKDLCMQQIPEKCEKDATFLHQLYSRQIVSDCKGFDNTLKIKESEADLAIATAEGEVRAALKESFDSANKYDLGQCMVEFRKCMQTDDACGKDWGNCVFTIASENMQNNQAKSTAGTKVSTVNTYDITASTMEILESKRFICENVLNSCVVVRNEVWPAFLREAAPTIKLAENNAESKFRQSCLTSISTCIQNACKDDIVGKGVDTMDACLSRPDMVRSFCKIEIDPCERMEPLIWGYVTDKLAAMRVDACTQEVKDCFTEDTRCGENFQNCIGMDYDYIHDICPLDKLVVCKANNPAFSMDDLDSMLMGLYLNVDNSMMEQCQNIVEAKMEEICGSTTDCNLFAADDTIGTGSLRSQKDGNVYRVTGMISFGSIKMGDATGRLKDTGDDSETRLEPGQIGVQEYLSHVRKRNADVANGVAIISSIEEELNNIAGTINRTIEMIEQDPEIQYCINGRDLSQITGNKRDHTSGRFPNLLTQVKMQIAVSALRKAQNNYNEKLNKEITAATKDASADLAQYMCYKMAQNGGTAGVGSAEVDTPLTAPYAISYDVGAGINNSELMKQNANMESQYTTTAGSGVTRTVSALFSREERNCHICTTVTTQSCTKKGGFLGIGKKQSCTVTTKGPDCQDIIM
ncbi:MAG: hypothetical protein NC311_06045 [Muribaculaceae bacterium]|nr:hypothetical protein [Muribaculaceae bacterium]